MGEIQAAYPEAITTIGYVSAAMPEGTGKDSRCRQVRLTKGKDLSALEALQYWMDLISSGISPAQVELLGINGGEISAFEYRLALMLGASVAVVESSGREATRLFKDPDWANSKTLLQLPQDMKALKSFMSPRR